MSCRKPCLYLWTAGIVLGITMVNGQDHKMAKKIIPEKLPDQMEGVYYELKVGDLTAVIGDHHDHGSGRPGYTAIRHLSHKSFPYSCFRPRYAGLLHTRGKRKVAIIKISDREIIITPQGSKCGHWERFILTQPHYLDYEFNFYATGEVKWVTWCCYMNSLNDPGIYFLQNREWVKHYSPEHSIDASIAPSTMKELPKYKKVPNSRYPSGYASFPATFAPLRIDADRSFYFGHFHDMAFIWMFCRGDDIIPFMSPTGGGGRNNPAWDARYWLRDCVRGKKLSLKMRIALKPFVSNDDCLEEYLTWKMMLDSGNLDKLRYPLWDVCSPRKKIFYLEKPWDRPFEIQVFKTQLRAGSHGIVKLFDPDDKEIAQKNLDADGDQHHYIEMPPDNNHGIYRLEIDADEKSCWNIVTDLYRESIAADQPVKLHKRVSGRRFYFSVPKGAGSFQITFEGKQGTFCIWGPAGKPKKSFDLSKTTGVTYEQRVSEGEDGTLWSFSFKSDADVEVMFKDTSVPPAFSAYPAGYVAPPGTK